MLRDQHLIEQQVACCSPETKTLRQHYNVKASPTRRDYAVERITRIAPSARLEAQIAELLSEGLGDVCTTGEIDPKHTAGQNRRNMQ